MQKRIFTLPILIISLSGALAGYYFGVITQRNNAIAIRLNSQTQAGKYTTKTTEVLEPKIIAQPTPIAATTATTTQVKTTTTATPKYIPRKPQTTPVKKVVTPVTPPAVKKPVVTPTPPPVVQTPPAPTTKVS